MYSPTRIFSFKGQIVIQENRRNAVAGFVGCCRVVFQTLQNLSWIFSFFVFFFFSASGAFLSFTDTTGDIWRKTILLLNCTCHFAWKTRHKNFLYGVIDFAISYVILFRKTRQLNFLDRFPDFANSYVKQSNVRVSDRNLQLLCAQKWCSLLVKTIHPFVNNT